jgi:hypothetical protein
MGDKLGFIGDFTAMSFESFRPPFSKGGANPTRGALVAARTRRNLLFGVFFFAKLFSLRLWSQRKKRTNNYKSLM